MADGYIPKQGDIIIMNFDPQTGHEQKGIRPGLVISGNNYNKLVKGLSIVCPITNTDSNFPLHVKLDNRTKTTGVILCEHVRSVDLKERHIKFKEKLAKDLLDDVLDIVKSLF